MSNKPYRLSGPFGIHGEQLSWGGGTDLVKGRPQPLSAPGAEATVLKEDI